MRAQLSPQRPQRLIRRNIGSEIKHEAQNAAPLQVPQERKPKPTALARALDQPRHIGDHEARVPGFGNAEVRRQRCERIVGNLRPSSRQPRDQRGLSGIRKPNQPDVRDDLELEQERPLFAEIATLREARRAPARRDERPVPPPAASARGRDELAACPDEIGNSRSVVVFDDRAVWDQHDAIFRPRAVLAVPRAVPAFVRALVGIAREIGERCDVGIDAEDDRAAASSVAAVRPAFRLVRFARERDASVAAVTAADLDARLIDEGLLHAPTVRQEA